MNNFSCILKYTAKNNNKPSFCLTACTPTVGKRNDFFSADKFFLFSPNYNHLIRNLKFLSSQRFGWCSSCIGLCWWHRVLISIKRSQVLFYTWKIWQFEKSKQKWQKLNVALTTSFKVYKSEFIGTLNKLELKKNDAIMIWKAWHWRSVMWSFWQKNTPNKNLIPVKVNTNPFYFTSLLL